MGQALVLRRELDDAITVYNAARKIFIDTVGNDRPNVGPCSFNIGLALRQRDDKIGALKEYQFWPKSSRNNSGSTFWSRTITTVDHFGFRMVSDFASRTQSIRYDSG
jgi:hypothetical protein